ncbi:response regulator [Brachybacterium paraconglomeratum]|uniref:response regulator n=1 Tax=Brachybacterium paraconglomeratum TaxID=173362 RepID=UPI003FD1CE12
MANPGATTPETPDPKLDKSLANSLYRWKSQQDVKQRKILWVDDNPKRIQWERSSIELAGVATVWTGSTQSAMELLDGNRFDLVISDMKRGANRTAGLELIEKMRQESPPPKTPHTPVIIYSGRATPSHREASIKKGAVDQIADPYELIHCVISTLEEGSGL